MEFFEDYLEIIPENEITVFANGKTIFKCAGCSVKEGAGSTTQWLYKGRFAAIKENDIYIDSKQNNKLIQGDRNYNIIDGKKNDELAISKEDKDDDSLESFMLLGDSKETQELLKSFSDVNNIIKNDQNVVTKPAPKQYAKMDQNEIDSPK